MFNEGHSGLNGFVDSCQSLYPDIRWISTSEFMEYRSKGEWQIVDVRSNEERDVSIIPTSISLSDYRQHVKAFAGQPVLVYCTVGCRSAGYTQFLLEQGIDAYNLWGGVIDWAQHGGEFTMLSGILTRKVHTHGKRWNLLPATYIPVW